MGKPASADRFGHVKPKRDFGLYGFIAISAGALAFFVTEVCLVLRPLPPSGAPKSGTTIVRVRITPPNNSAMPREALPAPEKATMSSPVPSREIPEPALQAQPPQSPVQPAPRPASVKQAVAVATAGVRGGLPATTGSTSSLSSDQSHRLLIANTKVMAFKAMLLSHIARVQHYPDAAIPAQLQGEVIVIFVILRDGSVPDVRTKSSSGFEILDSAAIDTIRRAQPLPPIPADMPGRLNVVLPVAFNILAKQTED